MMLRSGLPIFLLLGGLALACSATPAVNESRCTPNAKVLCLCGVENHGTKICKADGKSFEECIECESKPPGPDPLAAPGHNEPEPEKPEAPKPDDTDTPDETPGTSTDNLTVTPGADPDPPTTTDDTGTSTNNLSSGCKDVDAPHLKPLKNSAPKVEVQKVADEATAAVGGKLVPGLYVQAWWIQFTKEGGETGPTKDWSKTTLEIMDGDVGRIVSEADGKVTTGGFRITSEGTSISLEYECANLAKVTYEYDAAGTSLILYDKSNARVFYRQKESSK